MSCCEAFFCCKKGKQENSLLPLAPTPVAASPLQIDRTGDAQRGAKAKHDHLATFGAGSIGMDVDADLRISKVVPGGAADAAGVAIGMKISAVNGSAFSGSNTRFLELLSSTPRPITIYFVAAMSLRSPTDAGIHTVAQLPSSTRINRVLLRVREMAKMRELFQQDVRALILSHGKDGEKCAELERTLRSLEEQWQGTVGTVVQEAEALDDWVASALENSDRTDDALDGIEAAIEHAQLTQETVRELRTLTQALAKISKELLSHKKRKRFISLRKILREAYVKVKQATAQFEQELVSNCNAVKFLVTARENLEHAFNDKEKWAICTVRLQELMGCWARVVSNITAVAEKVRTNTDKGNAPAAVLCAIVFVRLVRDALLEFRELPRALVRMRENIGQADVRMALDQARADLKVSLQALKDGNSEQILEGAALRQLKAEAAVDEGGALIDFTEVVLHAIGMIPGLGAVCQKLHGAITASRKVHELAEDALEMSESVIELGQYLVDLARLAKMMAEETKRELEIYMHQLSALIGDMGEAIKSFGGEDFFGRMLIAVRLTKRMVFLEKRKNRILDAIQRRLQNAQLFLQLDAKEHTYKLEAAVLTKAQQALDEKGSNVNIQATIKAATNLADESPEVDADTQTAVERATKVFANDNVALREVADSIGLSEEALQTAMGMMKTVVKEEAGKTRRDVHEEHDKTREHMHNLAQDIRTGVQGDALTTAQTLAAADVAAAKAKHDHLAKAVADMQHVMSNNPNNDPIDVILLGNPGVGKSTILRTISGLEFESGVSFGAGLTTELQFEKSPFNPNLSFGDTPGLADPELRAKAAVAITKALKSAADEGRAVVLLFCLTLEAGRVKPADAVTIEDVMKSIQLPAASDKNNKFGVIMNNIPQKVFQQLNADNKKRVEDSLWKATSFTTDRVLYMVRDDAIDGSGNAPMNACAKEKLESFIFDTMSATQVVKAKQISKVHDTQRLKDMEKRLARERERLAEAEEKAKREIEAKEKARLEAERATREAEEKAKREREAHAQAQ
jgi:GTP-binding protein EngB required for normal cell division